ncbi:MAG: lysylphosphatidylglycerol synthase transmembrane domain-containing protein [Gammaproteobacteria bacterium]
MNTKYMQFILGITISIICLWLTFRNIQVQDVLHAISTINGWYILAGFFSLCCAYLIRISRWMYILSSHNLATRLRDYASVFLSSIALNNVLPFRIGDMMRVLLFPPVIGVTKTQAAASLVVERISDVITLLIFLSIGLLCNPTLNIPSGLIHALIGLGVITLMLIVVYFLFQKRLYDLCVKLNTFFLIKKYTKRQRISITILQVLDSFTAMSMGEKLINLLLLSSLSWISEAGLFWFLLHAFAMPDVSVSKALIVLSTTVLSTLVPSAPGYVGTFHLVAASTALMLGANNIQAAGFAVVTHFCLWLPTTLAGIIAMLCKPTLFTFFKGFQTNHESKL